MSPTFNPTIDATLSASMLVIMLQFFEESNSNFEEIRFIFNNYDNKDLLKEDFIANFDSKYMYMEFLIETPIKEESELFRVTNKRFIERKRNGFTRRDLLIQG